MVKHKDGSWGYYHSMPGSGSMTCAGLACVSIASKHSEDKEKQAEAITAIRRATQWLTKHFTLKVNPTDLSSSGGESGLWHFCYLHDLERAARLTGSAKFGDHDWRHEGIRLLLDAQDGASGAWKGSAHAEEDPVISTSLALLFLRPEPSEARPRGEK